VTTPKQRFLQHKDIAKEHRDIVDRDTFSIAMDMALLDLLHNLSHADNNEQAAANYYVIRGAMNYMAKLSTLADTTPEKKQLPEDNLMHLR
jgi:hypothetical protein